MSYLRYMCLFGLSLPSVVCRRAYVLAQKFKKVLPLIISNDQNGCIKNWR